MSMMAEAPAGSIMGEHLRRLARVMAERHYRMLGEHRWALGNGRHETIQTWGRQGWPTVIVQMTTAGDRTVALTAYVPAGGHSQASGPSVKGLETYLENYGPDREAQP